MKLIVYLRNLLDNTIFLFVFIFWEIFLGAHNVWTLPFSVWIRPWKHGLFFFTLWPLYWWSSTASRLEPLRRGSLLFTTKLPTSEGWKAESTLEPPSGFWTWDPWIRNPVPWPLGHCSNSVEEVIYSRVKTISNSETTDYYKACKLSWIHFFALGREVFNE